MNTDGKAERPEVEICSGDQRRWKVQRKLLVHGRQTKGFWTLMNLLKDKQEVQHLG